jgi:LAO/AO transport system ATPase
MLEALLDRFRQKDRLALSRLLSHLARGEHVADILTHVAPPEKQSLVVAVTGSAGVGKSTLVGKLLETIRASTQTVAVLACDPQSPLSGGALLGDRFRMTSRPDDDGVFIRSLAAVGGHGALADNLDAMIRLLESFGFDVILLETVGAGQGDTAVRELVDAVVLLLQPETGDDLQWEKAGVLEVADVLVLHKADLPGAEHVEAQIRAALTLGTLASPPVIRVSSRSGVGVPELWQTISKCPRRRKPSDDAGELLRLAQRMLSERFARLASGDDVRQIIDRWREGTLDVDAAIHRLCQVLLSTPEVQSRP